MTNEDIKKIREMMEFLVKQKISEIVLKIRDPMERKLFELTGTRGVKELVQITKFSAGKISKLWQEWEEQGILVKEGKRYRKVM